MSQDEFRIGQLSRSPAPGARATGKRGGAALDAQEFPLLAALLAAPAATHRSHLDQLAAAAKAESARPALQQSLQAASQALEALYKNKDS